MTLNIFMLTLAYIGLGFTLGFFYGTSYGRKSGKIEGWVRAHVDMLQKIKVMKTEFIHLPQEKVKILVVEDNDDARAMLVAVLHLYGYDVIEASTGLEGYAKSKAYDCPSAIIDIKLPGNMSGFDLAKKIRSTERIKKMKLVALSGMDIDNEKFIDSGFDTYLMKPYDLDRLIESVSVN